MSTRSDVGVYFRAYDQASGPMRSLGLTTQNLTRQLLGLAGVGGGLYGLTRAFGAVTKAAMAAEESENLFRVSMGDSAAATKAWSQTMSQALGLNQYEVRRNVATFNVMFESMGTGAEKANAMAKGLTQLAYDMASFYNLRPEEAFQKLQAGITGEVEPLKRLGIIVNETRTKEFALRQGWIQHGETLSETGKLYARYGLIMQDTAKAQGDLERTADSATNTERRLAAQWEQSKIVLGETLLPAYQQVMAGIANYLQTNQDDIAAWANNVVSAMGTVAKAIGVVTSQLRSSESRDFWPELNKLMEKDTIAEYEFAMKQAGKRPWAGMAQKRETGAMDMDLYRQIRQSVESRYMAQMDREKLFAGGGITPGEMPGAVTLSKLPGTYGAADYAIGPIAAGETLTGGSAAAVAKKTADVSTAIARMYDQIDRKTKASFDARRRLLMEQAGTYEDMGISPDLIHQWERSQSESLDIEQGKATGGLFGGFAAGIAEMNRELLTTGELGANLATTLRDGVVGSISDAIFEARDLGDALREVGRSMARMAMEWALNQAVTGGMNMAFGVKHAGGVVGPGGLARMMPVGLLNVAPRLHGGLAADEFPAILQRGETVIPRGGATPNVAIQVVNNGTAKNANGGRPRWDGDRWVIGVVLDDLEHGGPLSQRIGR